MKRVLVDGRVFSSGAFDRGMGRYVMHLLDLLEAQGHEVTILLFRNCYLPPDDPQIARRASRFANYNPEEYVPDASDRARLMHEFTAYLSALIEAEGYDVYIDATPFLGPLRLDIFGCATVAVCYDLIPLKHPDYYLTADSSRKVYYNGLARLVKADQVLCISETTRVEASRYLGISANRLSVLTPVLEDRYSTPLSSAQIANSKNYLFAILGSHKSKNPDGSLSIYAQLLRLGRLRIRVNAPKHDQMEVLRSNLLIPEGVQLTASVSDEEKFELQSNAKVVAHLSLEEGFGIPLLEALFLGRKVIALDTAVNREFFEKAPVDMSSAVFLLQPDVRDVNLAAFSRFLDVPADPEFFHAIRSNYQNHWRNSPALMSEMLDSAMSNYRTWGDRLQAKIFSSIPGTACGVADYSVAYARSAMGNVMYFFSEGEQENLSYLPNIRAGSYLDFERFSHSRFAHIKGLFNFAFSSALHPGIRLMRRCSKQGDVVLIHERRYYDGLRHWQTATPQGVDELLLDFSKAELPDDRTRLARDLAYQARFNTRNSRTPSKSPIASAWLTSLPVRPISHLPPAVLEQMKEQARLAPGSVVNDLESLESDFEFVSLGIDDRRHPSVARAAQRLRILRQVQLDDIVVGHCGLILNDLKRLWDVASAFLTYAARRRQEGLDHRRFFFFLVGKVIDVELFERIRRTFLEAGLADRLIHSTPSHEAEFDAEIAACDAIACFRIQTRGQLSHVFVRALSLGTPVLVNRRSGYSYDPRTTVDDADIPREFSLAIDRLLDPVQLAQMRRRAREEFETTHRGDVSLKAILRSERECQSSHISK